EPAETAHSQGDQLLPSSGCQRRFDQQMGEAVSSCCRSCTLRSRNRIAIARMQTVPIATISNAPILLSLHKRTGSTKTANTAPPMMAAAYETAISALRGERIFSPQPVTLWSKAALILLTERQYRRTKGVSADRNIPIKTRITIAAPEK